MSCLAFFRDGDGNTFGVTLSAGDVVELSKLRGMAVTEPQKSDLEKMTVASLWTLLGNLGLSIAKSAKKDNIINQIITNWNTVIASQASSSASALTSAEGDERGGGAQEVLGRDLHDRAGLKF